MKAQELIDRLAEHPDWTVVLAIPDPTDEAAEELVTPCVTEAQLRYVPPFWKLETCL